MIKAQCMWLEGWRCTEKIRVHLLFSKQPEASVSALGLFTPNMQTLKAQVWAKIRKRKKV